MSSAIHPATAAPRYAAPSPATADQVPWQLYAVALAAACTVVGITWDIAWHMTIGRDTFWTPAHMCTYAAGLIVGVTCGWTALHTTFRGSAEERDRTVSFWGFRAPLGAWICVWGSFAMLTSAPFDDWWHNAYGLDVKIISPPHALLAVGMQSIVFGALVWTLGWQNRAHEPALKRRLERLFLFDAGVLIAMMAVFTYEYSERMLQHSSIFYRVSSMAFPMLLVGTARGSSRRWPATTAALVYMAIRIVMGWILPLFPAEPKLGPIFNPLDHMATMEFPLLLVAPAGAVDLLMQRLGRDTSPSRDWALAPVYALAFVSALLLAQWPFADFLMSPLARNWIFFTHQNFSYAVPPSSVYRRYEFRRLAADATAASVAASLGLAVIYATLSARVGLAWGRWMRAVQR